MPVIKNNVAERHVEARRILAALAAAMLVSAAHISNAAAADPQVATADESIRPFQVHVPQSQLDDLRRRIADTRWPDKETVGDISQGIQLANVQALVRYWGTDYDWRKAEAQLNALPEL